MFGREWDKGHFIAHSIGGAVDGLETNVSVQLRHLNRGWSAAGKQFRDMEQYCVLNRGTFCFWPLYVDETARPAFVEFGVLNPVSPFARAVHRSASRTAAFAWLQQIWTTTFRRSAAVGP